MPLPVPDPGPRVGPDDPQRALEFGDATSSVKNTIPGDLPSSDFDEVTSIIRSHHSTGPQSELNR